jgi:chemotaxis protein CheD
MTAAAPGAERNVTVIQGTFHVARDPAVVLSTVLGSCVAVCLFDPVARVGGMNHFLLAAGGTGTGDVRYGVHAMELLINELIKLGAGKRSLMSKAFGGATMLANLTDIGAANAEFARRFLQREGIPILSESLGDDHARRVRFRPTTGQASVLRIPRSDVHLSEVAAPQPALPKAGKVELF